MLLSVIIPSYNTLKILRRCLQSVFAQKTDFSFEVIVVDNASCDGSPQMVKKEFPQASVVVNKKNLGFGGAVNKGVERARGKYILILNSDTLILPGVFSKIIKWINNHSQVGVVGCQILNLEKKNQPSGGYFPTLLKVFLWMSFLDDLPFVWRVVKPYHIENKKFFTQERELDWVQGCFLLIPRLVFQKVHGFDESFFMYNEEVDLCFRIKKRGYKVYFTPRVSIIHLGGASFQNPKEGQILGEYQSLVYFFTKYQPFWQVLILRCLLKLGAILRVFVFGIIGRNEAKRKIYWKAFRII
jgi:hypothetical protein